MGSRTASQCRITTWRLVLLVLLITAVLAGFSMSKYDTEHDPIPVSPSHVPVHRVTNSSPASVRSGTRDGGAESRPASIRARFGNGGGGDRGVGGGSMRRSSPTSPMRSSGIPKKGIDDPTIRREPNTR